MLQPHERVFSLSFQLFFLPKCRNGCYDTGYEGGYKLIGIWKRFAKTTSFLPILLGQSYTCLRMFCTWKILSHATYHRAPRYGGMRTWVKGFLACGTAHWLKPPTWVVTVCHKLVWTYFTRQFKRTQLHYTNFNDIVHNNNRAYGGPQQYIRLNKKDCVQQACPNFSAYP